MRHVNDLSLTELKKLMNMADQLHVDLKYWSDESESGPRDFHLYNPTDLEIMDLVERALQEGVEVIWIHTESEG